MTRTEMIIYGVIAAIVIATAAWTGYDIGWSMAQPIEVHVIIDKKISQ